MLYVFSHKIHNLASRPHNIQTTEVVASELLEVLPNIFLTFHNELVGQYRNTCVLDFKSSFFIRSKRIKRILK